MDPQKLFLIAAIAILMGCGGSITVKTEVDAVPTATVDLLDDKRHRMVSMQIEDRGVKDRRVLDAMRSVPRHEFVPESQSKNAYRDSPLPIGMGQTISQPYIVALMTELLEIGPGSKVLEVGTGSGYQAAVLSEIGVKVYTVEIIPELAERASTVLDTLGYSTVRIRTADGYFGWEENAPFDAIIVTAAPDHVPPPLLAQLSETGSMVIPVGPPGGVQTLWLVKKQDREWISINKGAVRFVPFTGGP